MRLEKHNKNQIKQMINKTSTDNEYKRKNIKGTSKILLFGINVDKINNKKYYQYIILT